MFISFTKFCICVKIFSNFAFGVVASFDSKKTPEFLSCSFKVFASISFMFFKKLSRIGLNFCKDSSFETLSNKFERFVETFPKSFKALVFLSMFSIEAFDFVPFFRFSNKFFKTSLTEPLLFLTICSRVLESASFNASFKTLLSLGISIFNRLLLDINILDYNII